MKRFLLTIVFVISSIAVFSQTIQDATTLMNQGNYTLALQFIEGLEAMDAGLQYDNLRQMCECCCDLQNQAEEDIGRLYYTNAIKKYQTILQYNPDDKHAKKQIERCRQWRANYINKKQGKSDKTYENTRYGYRIKYPSYLTRVGQSEHFISKEKGVELTFITKIYDNSKTNYEILNERRSYHETLKWLKDDSIKHEYPDTLKRYVCNWRVLTGYQNNQSKIYYERSYVVTRKNQYGESLKLLVTIYATTLVSVTPSALGNAIPDYYIQKTFSVDEHSSMSITETDADRWIRIKAKGTIEALENYIKTAPKYSKHLQEARTLLKTKQSKLAIERAEKHYREGNYLAAKVAYEQEESLLSHYERARYNESRYQCCLKGWCYIDDIQKLMTEYEKDFQKNLFRIFTLRGCIVKQYCAEGQFSKAKDYLKRYNRREVWNNEKPYSKSQWRKYIKQQEKTYVRIGSWTTSRSIYK